MSFRRIASASHYHEQQDQEQQDQEQQDQEQNEQEDPPCRPLRWKKHVDVRFYSSSRQKLAPLVLAFLLAAVAVVVPFAEAQYLRVLRVSPSSPSSLSSTSVDGRIRSRRSEDSAFGDENRRHEEDDGDGGESSSTMTRTTTVGEDPPSPPFHHRAIEMNDDDDADDDEKQGHEYDVDDNVDVMQKSRSLALTHCAGRNDDPYAGGVERECCYALGRCLRNWPDEDGNVNDRNDNWHFKCVPCWENDPCVGEYTVTGSCLLVGSGDDGTATSSLFDMYRPTLPSTSLAPPVKRPERPSRKRGIALQEAPSVVLSHLRGAVSWGYSWEASPSHAAVEDWTRNDIDYFPMVWGSSNLQNDHEMDRIPYGTKALLGFNEPNFVSQSNLHPSHAAHLWKDVEALAAERDIPVVVSPSMNFSPNLWNPIDWLRSFFGHCRYQHGIHASCRVDAIAIHSYVCDVSYLDEHIRQYAEFGRPIWVTEFACADDPTPGLRDTVGGQMNYMREAVAYLEQSEYVARYSWYSYDFESYDNRGGRTVRASLVDANGLTKLGRLYRNLPSA